MGGFAQNLGHGIVQNAQNRSPVFKALYNRYMSGMNPAVQPGYGQTANTDGWTIGGQPMGATPSGGAPGGPPMGSPPPSGQIPGPTGPSGGDPEEGEGMGVPQLASGTVVNKPIIAKLGEGGPEAVVPLTPRAGNKMQPDILEGRVPAPRVPGVHYSRYKGYNRFGGGAGGQV